MHVATTRTWAGRRYRVALLVVACLLLASCGSRLERAEIVAAHGGVSQAQEYAAPTGGQQSPDASVPDAVAEQSTTTAPQGQSQGNQPDAASSGGDGTPGPAATAPTATAPAGEAGAPAGVIDPSLPTVVLGNIGEYSGPVAASLGGGRPMASVMEQWLNNNGGLGGHRVRIVVADNQGDPSRYQAIARDMVENQGVIAFIGNMVPLTAPGADSYLRQNGIPVVGGEGAHSLWSTSPVMFFPGSTWGALWIGMAKMAADRGKPNVAVLYCGEAEPCQSGYASIRDNPDKVQAAGAKVVYSAQVSIVQPDYTAECLAAKDAGAQTIITAMDANSLSRVARSCSAQGYKPMYVTGGPALVAGLKDDPNMSGLTLLAASPDFPWVATDTPAAQEFQNAIATYNPSMENSEAAAQLWAGGKLLQLASQNLSANPTSAEIIDGLHAIRNETLGGLTAPVSFPAGTLPRPYNGCYFVIELSGGQWTAPQGSETSCVQ